MKIPKKIEILINRRAKLAKDLNLVDYELSEWLDGHNVFVEDYDYRTGCEMYANPDDSAERIKKAILSK